MSRNKAQRDRAWDLLNSFSQGEISATDMVKQHKLIDSESSEETEIPKKEITPRGEEHR